MKPFFKKEDSNESSALKKIKTEDDSNVSSSPKKTKTEDDSNVSSPPKKTKTERAQTFFSNSFRMAASMMGANTGRGKAEQLNIPNLSLVDKEEYKKQPECQICFCAFGKLNRQHHCRVCANSVCSSCSYSTINKERACDKCAYHYSDPGRDKIKQETISALTTLCVHYLGNKLKVENELKNLQDEMPSEEDKELQRRQGEERVRKLNEKLEELDAVQKQLEKEIEVISSR